jgi:hypothetical protein
MSAIHIKSERGDDKTSHAISYMGQDVATRGKRDSMRDSE